MNYPLYLARRLSLSSGGRKSTPAIKVSITAVALSIAVMIASISIVLGFKREIRDKVVGFNSHLTLYAQPMNEGDDNLITLTPSLEKVLGDIPYIEDYSLEASIPAVLKTSEDFKGIYLRSLNGAAVTDFIKSNLEEGAIPDFTKEENNQKILISRIAANQLGLKKGDRIDTYFFSNDIRVRRLEVAGIFNTHFDSYDDVIVYGALPLVQKLGNINADQGTGLHIHTDDFSRVDEYGEMLHARMVEALANGELFKFYRVDTAKNQGAGYFHWLSMLDTNVWVILTLMTIVAIATLISGMLILILDKKRFIGLVRALGAPVSKTRDVFVFLAWKVAVIGMLIGNVLMIAFLWAQDKWHFLPLEADSYYIDFVPVELNWGWILLLNAGVLVVIYLSLILPSRFVAKISPAETMKEE